MNFVLFKYAEKCPIYSEFSILFISGVTSKIDYLTSLGVGSVWMSSVYKAGDRDNGYDVIDHKAIDSKFGTMEDMKALIEKLHAAGIKLILDFIPNHTSLEHPWFKASVKNEAPYNDYYVWKTGNGRSSPPTTWV